MNRDWTRRFTVDGLIYKFRAVNGGAVSFEIIGGATKLRSFETDDFFTWQDAESIADGQYHRNAVKVLRCVRDLLLEWVFTERPHSFSIWASTERKRPVYQWGVRRVAQQVSGRYDLVVHGETAYFFRRNHQLE